MEFQSVINKRKMIRSFEDKPIPKDILDRILSNSFKGPSAGFSQGIEVLVLTQADDKGKFYSQWGTKEERKKGYTKWPKLENAAVIIIVCSHKNAYLNRYAETDKGLTDKDESHWPVPYWHIDSGMAALLGLLTVVDEELGAVFTGCSDLDYVRREFNIPDEYTPIGALLIGYPAETDPQSPSLKRGRRSLDNVIHYGTW
ncbi:MAG: nitroreductase family protein [Candidatus Heimdallarchaeota archaeon]|nr:nitroreductase family protein [Candidatus Heimdallarchaeota archaeon]